MFLIIFTIDQNNWSELLYTNYFIYTYIYIHTRKKDNDNITFYTRSKQIL